MWRYKMKILARISGGRWRALVDPRTWITPDNIVLMGEAKQIKLPKSGGSHFELQALPQCVEVFN
jgi:hypothetical protein